MWPANFCARRTSPPCREKASERRNTFAFPTPPRLPNSTAAWSACASSSAAFERRSEVGGIKFELLLFPSNLLSTRALLFKPFHDPTLPIPDAARFRPAAVGNTRSFRHLSQSQIQ